MARLDYTWRIGNSIRSWTHAAPRIALPLGLALHAGRLIEWRLAGPLSFKKPINESRGVAEVSNKPPMRLDGEPRKALTENASVIRLEMDS